MELLTIHFAGLLPKIPVLGFRKFEAKDRKEDSRVNLVGTQNEEVSRKPWILVHVPEENDHLQENRRRLHPSTYRLFALSIKVIIYHRLSSNDRTLM